MKIFFATIIIAVGLFSVIISLDLLMGMVRHEIIRNALNPFQVMETGEYLIIILFLLYFLASSLGSYFKKKRKSSPPSK
jgi:heme/copper-type cytochrome/quinol oxidase subunit 1